MTACRYPVGKFVAGRENERLGFDLDTVAGGHLDSLLQGHDLGDFDRTEETAAAGHGVSEKPRRQRDGINIGGALREQGDAVHDARILIELCVIEEACRQADRLAQAALRVKAISIERVAVKIEAWRLRMLHGIPRCATSCFRSATARYDLSQMREACAIPNSSARWTRGVSISNCTRAVLAAVLPWAGSRRSSTMVAKPIAAAVRATSAPVMPLPTITTSARVGARSGPQGTDGCG
jgi:hypothetical protein